MKMNEDQRFRYNQFPRLLDLWKRNYAMRYGILPPWQDWWRHLVTLHCHIGDKMATRMDTALEKLSPEVPRDIRSVAFLEAVDRLEKRFNLSGQFSLFISLLDEEMELLVE
jgi:hypothetical protein